MRFRGKMLRMCMSSWSLILFKAGYNRALLMTDQSIEPPIAEVCLLLQPAVNLLHLSFLRHFQSVINFNAKITHCAL